MHEDVSSVDVTPLVFCCLFFFFPGRKASYIWKSMKELCCESELWHLSVQQGESTLELCSWLKGVFRSWGLSRAHQTSVSCRPSAHRAWILAEGWFWTDAANTRGMAGGFLPPAPCVHPGCPLHQPCIVSLGRENICVGQAFSWEESRRAF